VDQFNWTDVALANLSGVTLTDVADVLYGKPGEVMVRRLAADGRIVMGRSEAETWVAILLIRSDLASDVWDISFARAMTPREIEEWRRWKRP
jgi:hypothetical protein